jgi:parallel beta-helix repeat protein
LSYNNASDGITWHAVDGLIANNTLYGNARWGIWLNNSGNTVRNNIAYQNSSTNIQNDSTNTLSHNLTNEPLFVNAAAGDFHLQARSPAIDTGMAVSEVTTDFDKAPRPQGAGVDIGACEYTSSPRSPLSAPRNFRIAGR